MRLKSFMAITAVLSLFTGATSCSSDNGNTPIEVESVKVTPNAINLNIGETATLTVSVTPTDALYPEISWESSDTEIATVDNNGTVTAVMPGNAEITVNISGKTDICNVTVNPAPEPAAVGDYYYSDGTWSANIDHSKEIIGIVFWTGDPTENDPALRLDHPDCNHGLVISLDQLTSTWQTGIEKYGNSVSQWVIANAPQYQAPESDKGTDQPIQKIIGYNNTKAIEAFNAAPENEQWPVNAVAACVAYRSEVKAPELTSDWYLPSPKELSLLYAGEISGDINIKDPVSTNAEIINGKIADLGLTGLSEFSLWSSTEYKNVYTTAWNYYLSNDMSRPLSYSYKDWDEYARVRFVLAF